MDINTRNMGFVNFNGEEMQWVKFNDVVVYEAWKNLTANGIPPLTLTNCKGVDLLDYKIYGNSVQDGTPTPETPIEVESVGERTKNLLDVKTVYSNFANDKGGIDIHSGQLYNLSVPSLTGVFKENTQYTFSCDYELTEATTTISPQIIYTDGTKTHVYLGTDNIGKGQLKLISTAEKTVQSFSFTYGTNVNTRYECILSNMQIEEGSSVTEYEPYGYKIPVKVSGKNLTSVNSYLGKSIWGTRIIEMTPLLKNLIPGTLYRISADFICDSIPNDNLSGDALGFNIVGKNSPTIGLTTTYTISLGEKKHFSISFRLPENVTIDSYHGIYAYMNYYGSAGGCGGRLENIQIEEGSETNFEPYVEPVTTNIYLDEPLRRIGEYADYIDFARQKVFRNVEVIDDTGTLTIEESFKGVADNKGTNIELPNIPTIKGTTILSVDTNIQPTNMEVVYKGKQVK